MPEIFDDFHMTPGSKKIVGLPNHLLGLASRLEKQVEAGDDSAYEALQNLLYEHRPVGIREFIESPDFLGDVAGGLHENWKAVLEEVFDDESRIVTLILTGSIGCGKTTAAMIANAFIAYRICCLRNPQLFFGLLPGSKIVIGIFNVTLLKASSGYGSLKDYIDRCPWFKKYCPRKKRPDEPIFFPKKNLTIEAGSMANHALGENIFAFSMDEADFYSKVADPSEKTRAHQLFTQARTRIYSRFVTYGGRIPGICILMSSRKTEAHFLEQLMEDISKDEELIATTRVVSFSLWECKAEQNYCGDTFTVMVGDDMLRSRILEDEEIPPDGYQVINVPVEYEQSFRMDCDDSIRDVAGISTAGSFSFFPDKVLLRGCVDYTRNNPFRQEEITTLTLGSGNKLQDYIDITKLCDIQRSSWMPLLESGAKRYVHIDLGLTGEAAGLCMAHGLYYPDGGVGMEVDLLIRILGKPQHEVDLTAIVEFLIYLKSVGFDLEQVTYDNFQSRHSIQLLTSHRIIAGIQSVKIEAYDVLKAMISTGRCHWYPHSHMMKELIELRKGEAGGISAHNRAQSKDRPRHPPTGSDDMADALAACAMHVSGLAKIKKSELGERIGKPVFPLIMLG